MEPCNEISPGLNSPYQDFVFLHNCDGNTKHVIQTMLDVEQNVYFKNVDYMKNVQKDGIKENWREKVAVWSFNVSLIFLVVIVSHKNVSSLWLTFVLHINATSRLNLGDGRVRYESRMCCPGHVLLGSISSERVGGQTILYIGFHLLFVPGHEASGRRAFSDPAGNGIGCPYRDLSKSTRMERNGMEDFAVHWMDVAPSYTLFLCTKVPLSPCHKKRQSYGHTLAARETRVGSSPPTTSVLVRDCGM
mmetsp:Transcript_11222/g.20457  ORF Transcript_11222/g.20457 Transcript_11222/m.20457 type:complete len:247 (-) Transcript_11222:331-1071(-)